MGGFSISPAGRFSGKRVVRDSGHGSDVKYTIKVAGSFTAPTRAHGTYSLVWTSSSPKGDRSCHSGKQTWKANHVGSSK